MTTIKPLFALSLLTATTAAAQDDKRPNIILFLVDDMGWCDSEVAYDGHAYPNNLRHETPNMLRLAREGVVMSDAYACPVSTPTRTSLMTGMNAAHTGITNWTATTRDTPSDASGGAVAMAAGGSVGAAEGDRLSRPDWNINGLSPVEGIDNTQYATPLARLLYDAGYYTIMVGKAHWASAGTPGASPYNMGFTVNVSGNIAGMPRSYQGEDNYGNTPELWNYLAVQNMTEYYGTHTHLTEALTLEALKTLDYPIRHGEPFFLYMAHYATHTPIQRDDRFIQKYLDRGMDEGQARYASMVEGVDKSLGDILDYIESRGIADNTIIIFLTDNGGNSENKQKGGVPHTQNLPLREGKGSCYEGGIRVPLIFKWPGHVEPGTRISTPVIIEDLFPTIVDMARADSSQIVQTIDGESLVPTITRTGALDPQRTLVWHYPHKWKPYDLDDIDFLSAVRKGDWKLVYRQKSGDIELYNLKEDIGERNNLAAKYPHKVRKLAAELSDKLRAWNAPMPVIRATGEKAPMPDEILK